MDSAVLKVLQETVDSTDNIFNRLVNATSKEFFDIKTEIQSGLEITKRLVDNCAVMRPMFSRPCQAVTCCTGDQFDLEVMYELFLRLDFFARQLMVQLEEIVATLILLQEGVSHLTCHGMRAAFTRQDYFDLAHGIEILRGCQRRTASSPFFRHSDYFGLQLPAY